MVVPSYNGLVTLEPRKDMVREHKVKMANRIAVVVAEQTLLVLLRNFGAVERR